MIHRDNYIPMVIETNLSKNDMAIYHDVHIMMYHDISVWVGMGPMMGGFFNGKRLITIVIDHDLLWCILMWEIQMKEVRCCVYMSSRTILSTPIATVITDFKLLGLLGFGRLADCKSLFKSSSLLYSSLFSYLYPLSHACQAGCPSKAAQQTTAAILVLFTWDKHQNSPTW